MTMKLPKSVIFYRVYIWEKINKTIYDKTVQGSNDVLILFYIIKNLFIAYSYVFGADYLLYVIGSISKNQWIN